LDECEGCSGDIGTPDDVVDQYDLQTLLGLWGADDTAGDIDGDGTVGISDLLAMLVNWGPC
ncbi:MAG: GC-type dockerin domain-anchored protein, partial [Phycisphaerales bacterium]|nr:GC-type dockerin domain-anchored protein [Phycisphaerales bacterium]